MYDAVLVDISTMDHWQWSLDTKLHTDLTAKVVRVLRSERAATKKGFKRIYRRGTNSRIHHFLPECIAFHQSALRHFLPEYIVPRGIRGCQDGCHTACNTTEPSSFSAWVLMVSFCSGLPVKRREEDRA